MGLTGWSGAGVVAGVLAASAAFAAAPVGPCRSIDDDAARLACHDRESGRRPSVPTPVAQPAHAPATAPAGAAPAADAAASTDPLSLATAWELTDAHKRGTFNLLPHRLNYLLPARQSFRVNDRPGSPAPDHGSGNRLPVEPTEAKFQISLKLKAAQNIFGDNGDLWLAYTQQSNWQLYNRNDSSPFRETNYEPEAILAFRTGQQLFGWTWRMVNLGFVHQSNGRPLPFSRSWNRLYAQFGFERGSWTVLVRPWVRLPERAERDDNPDIRDYLGNGDLRLVYQRDGHLVSALGRYSPSGKRGFGQLDWAFPISRSLRGYVQVTTGYGESLIDYNHAQSTLGIGILVLPWQ